MAAHALQKQVTGFPEMDEQRWFLLLGIYASYIRIGKSVLIFHFCSLCDCVTLLQFERSRGQSASGRL